MATDGDHHVSKTTDVSKPVELAEQAAMESIREQKTDLDRYLYLRNLEETDENLFFRLLMTYTEELLPHVYTPTVGEACQKYSKLPVKTRGIIITPADKGKILAKLQAWAEKDIRVIVATDGERILGLGDLGYNGMGISEGKILLYTVIAGVDPKVCLPIGIDVGTNNQSLLDEPEYKGLRQRRLRGPEYDELIDELMAAVRSLPSHALFQFEDFGNTTAFEHLAKYRNIQCCFNDDIQGTACITLAGILSALRVTKQPLGAQRVLFLGAGEAGAGIAELIALAIAKRTGISIEEARKTCFFMDSKGLVCKSRLAQLQHHKIPFAHDISYQASLVDTIKAIKPTALIGVSTMAGAFTKEVVEVMSEINDRPVIFPLSNPTSKSECTYKEAFEWSKGKVVFASGSPFPPLVAADGITYYPAQANNAYVFGPIGMAAVLTECRYITDDVFLESAEVLASITPQDKLEQGLLFPPFEELEVGKLIGKIAEFMVKSGLSQSSVAGKVKDWVSYASQAMWHPPAGRFVEVAPHQPTTTGSSVKLNSQL